MLDRKAKHQEQLRRMDANLERLYREHRIWFNVVGFAAAVVICAIAYLLMELTPRIVLWLRAHV